MPKIHFGAQEYINVLSAKGSGYWAAVQALSLTRRAWRRKKQVRHSSFDQDTSLTVYAVDGRGASWLQWRPVEPWMKNVHSVFNKGAMHNLCSHYFSLSIQVYLAYSWCLLGLMLSPPTSPTGPARTVLSVLGYQPQISHRKSPAQEQRPLWSSISILNQYFKPHFECGQDSHADLVWHIANGGDLQYLIDTKHYITFKSQ